MRKILLIFTAALLLIIAGCLGPTALREGSYRPGIYEGRGMGLRGTVTVRIEISADGITDIEIIEHREWAYPGLAAMEELLELVLETGSPDLDAISGATFSSIGFLEAVENALGKAE
ncbi:MAG: FMN-binding protein [Treponema sp.]|nr:FMN-binding protein [Treponema sp.]